MRISIESTSGTKPENYQLYLSGGMYILKSDRGQKESYHLNRRSLERLALRIRQLKKDGSVIKSSQKQGGFKHEKCFNS